MYIARRCTSKWGHMLSLMPRPIVGVKLDSRSQPFPQKRSQRGIGTRALATQPLCQLCVQCSARRCRRRQRPAPHTGSPRFSTGVTGVGDLCPSCEDTIWRACHLKRSASIDCSLESSVVPSTAVYPSGNSDETATHLYVDQYVGDLPR